MAKYHIVMGDIIKSRIYPTRRMQRSFQQIISECNETLNAEILSPYTITLGDEFQGVAKSLRNAVESIFFLEEALLKYQMNFRMRYVVHFGEIETPLNEKAALGMMGNGLTRARKILTDKHRSKPRFLFELPDRELTRQLNRLFSVLDSVMQEWLVRDYLLIRDMLDIESHEKVGTKHGKNRSQIWKRKKTLKIREYKTLKTVILDMTKKN